MSNAIQQLKTDTNPLTSNWLFGLVVAALLPALVFSHLGPVWLPPLAAGGVLIMAFLRAWAGGGQLTHPAIDLALLGLVVMLAVGPAITAAPAATWGRTYAFAANIALFVGVAAQADAARLRSVSWLFLLGGPLLVVGLLAMTSLGSTKIPFIDEAIYTLLPAGQSAFWDGQPVNPNMSGGVIALFLMPVVVLIWRGASWPERDLAKFVALFMAAGLLLTQSRGAILAVAVATLVVTLHHSRRWLWFWAAVVAAVGYWVSQIGLSQALAQIIEPGQLSSASSWQGRVRLWQLTLLLIQELPLTGAAVGGVDTVLVSHYAAELQSYVNGVYGHAHNLFLYIASEMGLPGLAAHLALYVSLFVLLWQQARRAAAPHIRALALGLLGSLIVLLVHGLVDAIIFSPQVALVSWGLLGLMAAVGLTDRNQSV